MPAAAKDSAAGAATKRKRQQHVDQSKKRRKSGGADTTETMSPKAQLGKLESEILESRKHYNNIATLLELSQKEAEDESSDLAATEALCRVFLQLLAMRNLARKKDASEKDATVTGWLRDRLADYREVLLAMFHIDNLANSALMLAMALLKGESQYLDDRPEAVFPQYFFVEIVWAVISSPVEQLREQFSEAFLDKYDDIRFYTFEAIR